MKNKIKLFEDFNKEATKNIAPLAIYCLSLRDQIHVFHWQTKIGDAHQAMGEFYDDLLEKSDELIEVLMGKYDRFSVKGLKIASLIDLDDSGLQDYLDKYKSKFEEFRNETFSEDPEVQNIIDEIVALINKLKYLLSMS